MQFGNPTYFWLLALVPALIAFLVWAYRARRRALERFAAPPLAEKLATSVNRGARRWKAVLLVAAVLFALLALTRPRWGFEWREVKRKGVDIFVLLDVSKSMLTEDVRPNRLTQAKFAVKDLLNKLEGDRIGLIAFSGTAFVQCPLTVDYEAFRLTLNDANPGVIPRGGTAIGQAIQTALKAFETSEGRDHAIILITDGEDTEGDPVAAADEAAKKGVRIYAIGVGTSEGELIPVHEEGKALEFLKDSEGKVVKSRLNEEPLKELALKTQGIYVRSAAGDFGLDAIYEKGILGLHREEYAARLQKKYFERYQWPLGLALAFLVMEMFVTDRRRAETSRGRNVQRSTFNAQLSTTAISALVLCCVFTASADTATRLYEQGKYSEAFERYKKAAEKQPENWPLFYDLGAAAYKAGRPDEAAKAFERAASSQDKLLQARSFYNLGNSYYRIGEAAEKHAPPQAMEIYQRSLKSYENALVIDPKDEDAKCNHDLVKKKIEELKKQQEQQQQNQKQDQQKKNEDKDQQKKDQDQQKNQQQQNQKNDQQQQSQKPEDKKKQDQQNQQQQERPNKGKPEENPQPQAAQTNGMEKLQAQMLLDNLREEERNWNFFPELQMNLKDSGQPAKDW